MQIASTARDFFPRIARVVAKRPGLKTGSKADVWGGSPNSG